MDWWARFNTDGWHEKPTLQATGTRLPQRILRELNRYRFFQYSLWRTCIRQPDPRSLGS
nr:MAG TPA: hypothetical protein [Caudoviricetes sp.]